jgi:hypothetical protein
MMQVGTQSIMIRAVPTMAPDSLLRVAAKNAFWKFTLTQCRQIATLAGIGLSGGASSLFQVVFDMIKNTLGLNDSDALAITKTRFASMEPDLNYDEFIDLDDGYQLMSRDDEQTFRQEAKSQKNRQELAKQFKKEYKEKVKVVKTSGGKSSNAQEKALTKELLRYKGPAAIPEGEIEQRVAKSSVPPGTSIWRNHASAGWCGHCPPFKRISKPASTHGHRGAAVWVIRKLWSQFLELQGSDISHCPIRNLFVDSAADVAAFADAIANAAPAEPSVGGGSSSSSGPKAK